MPAKLRYACIGAGGIADKKHLNEYAKSNDIELIAICDTNRPTAERMAEKYAIPRIYDNYMEMLQKEELDLVSICTPNFLHAPIALEALQAGVHVHCEKPLAMNAAEAKSIMLAEKKSGKQVMVALNNRFTKESLFVKHYAVEGLFGEIYHAKCGWRRRSGIPGKGVWFTQKQLAGGGPLIDLGVHFIDLVMYFMGFPAVSSVFGATYSKFGDSSNRIRSGYPNLQNGIFDVEDMAVGYIRLQNGATIDFDFSWAANIEKETKYYELLGTKGGVSYYNGELKIFSEVFESTVNILPDSWGNLPSQNEFLHFIACLKTGEANIAPTHEAHVLAKVIDAIYLSAAEKREIII